MSRPAASDPENTLYYGDNLDVLRRYVPDECVDLIYLDPPFNSDADYNAFFEERDGTTATSQIEAFKDTWAWDQQAAKSYFEFVESPEVPDRAKAAMLAFEKIVGRSDMLAYLAMMAPRLVESKRVLKPTGSLYLHCDPTASHFLRTLLDGVFRPENFRSEIIWKRTSSHSTAKRFGPVHDTIYFYTKSAEYTWNRQHDKLSDDRAVRSDLSRDKDGRVYRLSDLTGAGTRNGESGKPWRGFDPNTLGRHWVTTVQKLDELAKIGVIYFPGGGKWPRLKKYLDEALGSAAGDVWDKIRPINSQAAERLGYPTQKPLALLERIIAASSDPGDMVLDPFCGCGTTIDAAQRLGRKWIGIDIAALATTLIKSRLQTSYGANIARTYRIVGEPTTAQDAAKLAREDPYQFQWWALGLVGARPVEQKKGVDHGIDGRLYFRHGNPPKVDQVVFSVKAGATVTVAAVRDLIGVVQREQAAVGVLLLMNAPTKPMREEAAAAGVFTGAYRKTHPKIQLLTVADLLAGKQVDLPPWGEVATFKPATRVKTRSGTTPSFDIPSGETDSDSDT